MNARRFHLQSQWLALQHLDERMRLGIAGARSMRANVRMTTPDLQVLDADGEPQQNEISLRPKQVVILPFPSWL